MLHLVLQGSKSLMIGDQVLRFEPATYFIVPVDVPALGQVNCERSDSPYLAVSLTLDPAIIGAMLVDIQDQCTMDRAPVFAVSALTPELADAWLRLMRLVDRPAEIPMLAPLIEREILFRVLQGPQGEMLRQIASADSRLSRMQEAVEWIRQHYIEPVQRPHVSMNQGIIDTVTT